MLTSDTELRTQHTCDKEDAVYQPIHQVQGKVPAFVEKRQAAYKSLFIWGREQKEYSRRKVTRKRKRVTEQSRKELGILSIRML